MSPFACVDLRQRNEEEHSKRVDLCQSSMIGSLLRSLSADVSENVAELPPLLFSRCLSY